MMLKMRIVAEDGADASRARLIGRYAMKYGGRVCGLVNLLMGLRRLKILIAWAPLAIFRRQPLELTTIRTIGELLWLFATVGFFFVLGKRRQALYDRFSGTAVVRRLMVGPSKRGFEPLPALSMQPGGGSGTIEP